MSNREQRHPQALKSPVPTRRNVQDYDDPYIPDEQLPDGSLCRICGQVFTQGRWYGIGELTADQTAALKTGARQVVCPACRKQMDRVPAGVVRLTGTFIAGHRDEILNLIRNETSRADASNPLERVMSMETVDGEIELTTTNEKLAQRIGKAIHKAYSGSIEYKWSGDNKLARVFWHRDI